MMKEKSDIINNATTLLKGREMVYNGFESGIFSLRNQPVLAKPEKSISSEYSASSEHSSDSYEYISIEEKILGRGLKLLIPKQMLQRLPIGLAQVHAGNTSE